VGAYGDNDAGSDSGSAYVFCRNQGGADNWGQVAKLTASDVAAGDEFGRAVSIDGDTAVIGARGDDDAGSRSGSAYVFYRDQGGADNWGQVAKLTASDAAAGDEFGYVVSISGDTAIVGAPLHDGGESNSGSAYVFYRDQGGADNWGEAPNLVASDDNAGDYFGVAVSVNGDTAIIGAFEDDDGGTDSGSAYVLQRNPSGAGSVWEPAAKLAASDAAAEDYFGWAVSIDRDMAVVGAYGDNAAATDCGSAYLFLRNQGGADNWGQVAKLNASDAEASDVFGHAVSISGGTAIVGAFRDDDGGANSGSAYLFDWDNDPPTPDPMTWAIAPVALEPSSIAMAATVASDPSGVEYYFECTGGGGHDSGWQDDPGYADAGLSDLTSYTYRVRARDKSLNRNATAWSAAASATTLDGTAPTPSLMTWAVAPTAISTSTVVMTATTASDPSGVEYYFECAGGGGHDSGWQDDPGYADAGLSELTSYTYRVRARDKSLSQNATAWSAAASATTLDGTAPTPNPMTWAIAPTATGLDSISMAASLASDPSGVEYSFECTAGGGHNSGWQDDRVYIDTGLAEGASYTYRASARDKSPLQNRTDWSPLASATTEAAPTPTPTATPMRTATPTPTATPSSTPTPSAMPTATATPTPTVSPTPTASATVTQTATPTPGGELTPSPTPEPIDALIHSFYALVLGRDPGAGEAEGWRTYFDYVADFNIDVRFIPREMARLFFLSDEYAARNRTNTEFITDCYRVFLNRAPNQTELDNWLAGVWNRSQVMTVFSESEEFANRIQTMFPGLGGNATRNFVTFMYVGLLDRLVDQSGLEYAAGLFDAAFAAQDSVAQPPSAVTSRESIVAQPPSAVAILESDPGESAGAPRKRSVRAQAAQDSVAQLPSAVAIVESDPGEGAGATRKRSGLEAVRAQAKQMAREVIQSAEFLSKNPTTAVYVTRFYRAFLGRLPNDAEVAYWSAELDSGRQTTDGVIGLFADSAEFTERLRMHFGTP
jgi:hypothetical protein